MKQAQGNSTFFCLSWEFYVPFTGPRHYRTNPSRKWQKYRDKGSAESALDERGYKMENVLPIRIVQDILFMPDFVESIGAMRFGVVFWMHYKKWLVRRKIHCSLLLQIMEEFASGEFFFH